MSENLDFVRSLYADWERGDFSRVDWADPEIEFVRGMELDSETVTGVAAMAAGFRRWMSAWAEFRAVVVDEYRELDQDSVLVIGRMSGRGITSGVVVESEFANVFRIREGRVARLALYPDVNKAFADLGLEE